MVFVLALVSCLATRPAAAAEGLFLSWDDCRAVPQGASNRDFACDTDVGQHELYVAFTMPQATDNVLDVEIVIDIQSAGTVLPNWWRLDSEGGCRGNNILQVAADFPGKSACVDMWQGTTTAATAGVQGYNPTEPRGAVTQARIKAVAYVVPDDARSLDASSMYYAARILIKNEGTASCSGCAVPVCLVLNSIWVKRLPDSPGGDFFLQTPGPDNANWVTWQSGTGANCAAVPVRKRAWGEIKSLYR